MKTYCGSTGGTEPVIFQAGREGFYLSMRSFLVKDHCLRFRLYWIAGRFGLTLGIT